MKKPILSVYNLNVALPVTGGTQTILREINFDLLPGTTTAVIGESGCGKTTLCKALLGLLSQKFSVSGNVVIGSRDELIATLNPGDPDSFCNLRGTKIGMLFQEASLTLNPVIKIGRQIRDLLPNPEQAEIIRLLEMVGFTDPQKIIDSWPHELSGGQVQRIGLSLALAKRPEILIVDEPATALDSIARREFLDLLRKIQIESGLTIMMVTHDLHILSVAADRLIVMFAGQIAEQGDCKSVLEQPMHPYTRSLLQIDRAFRNGQWPQ